MNIIEILIKILKEKLYNFNILIKMLKEKFSDLNNSIKILKENFSLNNFIELFKEKVLDFHRINVFCFETFLYNLRHSNYYKFKIFINFFLFSLSIFLMF